MFLDVNLGKGNVDRLIIMDGDDPMKVADEFCDKHSKFSNPRPERQEEEEAQECDQTAAHRNAHED